MKKRLLILPAFLLFLNGCGVDFSGGGVGSVKEETDAQGRKVVMLDVVSKTSSHDCDGKVYKITGVENKLTLKGECAELYVDGSKNEIHVEKVGKITVDGVKNRVTYGSGPDGKKPEIDNQGLESTVEQK